MTFTFTALIVPAISAAAVTHVCESRFNAGRLFRKERKQMSQHQSSNSEIERLREQHAPADVLFTRSLLALGKVGLRAPGDFPAPEPGESSSLVSIRRAQLRTPGSRL
jgi:hypothetical protein